MPILVDSNVILDIATRDPNWGEWSSAMVRRFANESLLVINQLIYAEASVGYPTIEELEVGLPTNLYRRESLPYEAAFLAGKAYSLYRGRGGLRTSPLPDFYIGA